MSDLAATNCGCGCENEGGMQLYYLVDHPVMLLRMRQQWYRWRMR